ncbi:MAG: DNA repair and recombination protein RadB [archaeon]
MQEFIFFSINFPESEKEFKKKVFFENMLPLGCKNMDLLLDGGLLEKVITEIYGAPGTGKTTFALQAALNAARIGKEVLFLDTESSFNFRRFEQMAGPRFKEFLKRITIKDMYSFEEQEKVCENIFGDLVIVDCFTYFYRLEKNNENREEINRRLGKILAKLNEHARKNNAAVLLTNQVYFDLKTNKEEPVSGDLLEYFSKVILELKNKEERKAILKKHVFKKPGQEVYFKITDLGIIDV